MKFLSHCISLSRAALRTIDTSLQRGAERGLFADLQGAAVDDRF
jgi:hypothetical protein